MDAYHSHGYRHEHEHDEEGHIHEDQYPYYGKDADDALTERHFHEYVHGGEADTYKVEEGSEIAPGHPASD